MLLQLSHFPPFIPFCPATPLPPAFLPTLVHVHGSYIQVLWLLHFLYYSQPPPVYFVPTIYTTYSLYLFPFSPPPPPATANPPCDLHFCDSVPILVDCLVCFCFCF